MTGWVTAGCRPKLTGWVASTGRLGLTGWVVSAGPVGSTGWPAETLASRSGRGGGAGIGPVGVWSGLWSLPEVARDADVALHVAARFNAATDALRQLPPVTHVFTHFALTMHPVSVPVTHWPPTASARGVEWFARESAINAAVPAPIRRLLLTLDLESPAR